MAKTSQNPLRHLHPVSFNKVCSGKFPTSWWQTRGYRIILPIFPPLPLLTCCAILTSFGGKGPHLRRWLVAQLSSDGLLAEVFLTCKANARRSVHSPRLHIIWSLSLADRSDWGEFPGKWSLARNPDRIWWHRNTNVKLFRPQSMTPCTPKEWLLNKKIAIRLKKLTLSTSTTSDI